MNVKRTCLVAAVAATAALGGTAYAAGQDHEDAAAATAIAQAKTSLTQAVAAAEQQSGGKALSADLESENGQPAYQVEVAKGGTVQAFRVDAMTGSVMPQAASQDHEGESND